MTITKLEPPRCPMDAAFERPDMGAAHPDAPDGGASDDVLPDAATPADAPDTGVDARTDAPAIEMPPQKLPRGATCSDGASCVDGHCVDGVCCESACAGACEACAETPVSRGTCLAVTGAPRPGHPACTGAAAACAGSCNGTLRTACTTSLRMCPGTTACVGSGACCGDSECPASSPVCNLTTHACLKRPNGANCTTQSECMSGTCPTCYPDSDGDNYGNSWAVATGNFCGVCPAGSVSNNLDCHDADNLVHPEAAFHTIPYAPASGDPTPDPWDRNCDNVRTREKPSLDNWPAGCLFGSACFDPGCLQGSPVRVDGPETCGGILQGYECDVNSCLNGSICRENLVTSYTQACR
jgi:hypothetical protein